MKNIKIPILIILLQLLALTLSAQDAVDNSEYRYFSVKFGIVNNVVPFPQGDENLLMRTPLGDMVTVPTHTINYAPGASFSLHYHIDAKTNTFGLVLGVQVLNYGYSVQYMSRDSNFSAIDMFRSTSVAIPLYIKYNPVDIFYNQAYLTIGLKQYINLKVEEYQLGSWMEEVKVNSLSQAQIHRFTSAFFVGVNYNVFYLNLEYNFKSFVNKDFKTATGEGVVRPFSNVDYRMKIYLTFGMNIPLNRWITMRSWTAERIRRIFSPVR